MTMDVRRDKEIYATDGGWFQARWHFSFDHYRDPAQMGIGALRVFNDDRLQPGAVWPLHPHQDIEGITFPTRGRRVGSGSPRRPSGRREWGEDDEFSCRQSRCSNAVTANATAPLPGTHTSSMGHGLHD